MYLIFSVIHLCRVANQPRLTYWGWTASLSFVWKEQREYIASVYSVLYMILKLVARTLLRHVCYALALSFLLRDPPCLLIST